MSDDIVDRLRRAQTTPLDPDTKVALFLVLSDALAEIARLREERRWIPVTERLPEDAQWVLALVPAYYGSQEARWLDGHWRDHFGRVGRPVTHWQPLPPPPGEREVEG